MTSRPACSAGGSAPALDVLGVWSLSFS